MENLVTIFRHAWRRLAKTPGASMVAVIAMGLGIGLTTLMFGVIQGLYLRGVPFTDSHELVHLESHNLSQEIEEFEPSQHDFEIWLKNQQSFESMMGYTTGTFNLADSVGLPERFDGTWISAGFDQLLDIEPVLGRSFRPEDSKNGAAPVLLLSNKIWQKRYGGDPDVIGRVVRLNAAPVTIIGVLPEKFAFPVTTNMWMPLKLRTDVKNRGDGGLESLEVVARLKDGVDIEAASLEMSLIADQIAQQFPETNEGVGVRVKPILEEFINPEDRTVTSIMFVAVILVLLIASFNVANLLIGRASVRGRELAIRSAIGAGRWHQVSSILAEAFILAGAGSLIGLVLAHIGLTVFDRRIQLISPPFWMEYYLDAVVVAMAVAFTLLAALVSGLVPAWQASRPDLRAVLSDGTRGSTSFHVGWVSRAMVITQVALSTALLIAAGLAVRSVIEANTYEHHFDGEKVLTARLGLFDGTYPDKESQLAFFEEIQRRLNEHPEVVSVGIGTVLPTDEEIGAGRRFYERPGEEYADYFQRPWARFAVVAPGYFETLGVPMLSGRDFSPKDHGSAPRVAIVNEEFAAREWPDQNPIGQQIRFSMGEGKGAGSEPGIYEVVGVVPNLRYEEFVNDDDQQGIYVPLAQDSVRFAWLIVKTRSDPLAFSEPLRHAVLKVDPDLPLYYVRSLEQVLERAKFFPNLVGGLFMLFGVAAVFLACVGLYGLMAFAVTRRTQEMGVRMALGAQQQDVLKMVLGQGLKQTITGLLVGIVLGGGLSVLLTSFLFEVKPGDPITFFVVPVLLLLVALLACAAPARRASAVDPLVALRYD